jgi:hypothetical protein
MADETYDGRIVIEWRRVATTAPDDFDWRITPESPGRLTDEGDVSPPRGDCGTPVAARAIPTRSTERGEDDGFAWPSRPVVLSRVIEILWTRIGSPINFLDPKGARRSALARRDSRGRWVRWGHLGPSSRRVHGVRPAPLDLRGIRARHADLRKAWSVPPSDPSHCLLSGPAQVR